MSNMSELDRTIRDLRNAATMLNETATMLAGMLGGKSDEPAVTAPAEPELTLEQVRSVLAAKSCKGHTAEIRALLQKYGANKLSGIDPTNYKALLAEAEAMTDAA